MPTMEEIRNDLLDLLTHKGSFKIANNLNELFKLKSGRMSTYFINLGSLTDGESLSRLKKVLSNFIALLIKEGKMEDFDFIYGPAYKGISLAALACEGLKELHGMNKRYLYDRKEVKEYGDLKADKVIVGADHFKPGNKILIIDDVITTGDTKEEALDKLKILGDHKVVGLVLMVDRQEKLGDIENVENISAVDNLKERYGLTVFSILNMKAMFDLVKHKLPDEIKEHWIEYSQKYGMVELS